MTDLIIQGINGRMGHTLVEKISARSDCRIVAGVDQKAGQIGDIPVYASLEDLPEAKGIVIDFTSPAGTVHAAQFCAAHGMPCVLCSTGLSKEDEAVVEQASEKVPVFRSANMSVGINLILELLKKCASVLGDGYDVEIIEKHHNQKLDAPSGTAIMLAEAVSSALPYEAGYVYDRHERLEKRPAHEIGIHAVRGGTIVGEHSVLFCGRDEIIEIKHSALSREVFAVGAVDAAAFLAGQTEPGMYDMSHVIASKK